MVLKIALCAGLLLAVAFVLLERGGDISNTDARQLVAQGARLVDVRTPEEFEAGHISGAVNIPVRELDRRLAELEPKQRPVVVYCRSGARSSAAARVLKQSGYDVHDLGAMSRW